MDMVLLPTIGGHWALMWTVDRSHLLPPRYSVCTGPWLAAGPRERWDGFGKMLFRGGKKNRNKHHLLNLTSSF